jgi:hypothetical protein
VLDALYRLTLAAARGPVVVLIDDLQWCDEPSLRFLAYLARRLEGTRLAVVATLARVRARSRGASNASRRRPLCARAHATAAERARDRRPGG